MIVNNLNSNYTAKNNQQNFGMALTMRTIGNLTSLAKSGEAELEKISKLIIKAGENKIYNVDTIMTRIGKEPFVDVFLTSPDGSQIQKTNIFIKNGSFPDIYNVIKSYVNLAKTVGGFNQ